MDRIRQKRNWRIFATIVVIIIAILVLIRYYNGRHQVEKPVKNAPKMAFKPAIPEHNLTDVIAGRDAIVYRQIPSPEKGARLVSTKYAKTIKKVAADMVKTGQIPSSESQGLIDALEGIVMIESGGKPLARSAKKAAGIVQMIPATARQFGKLKVNEARGEVLRKKILAGKTWLYPKLCQVDERYDPYKCIRGGARYLVHLFSLYGRWDFCVIAYHGGAGRPNDLLQIYMAGNYQDLGHNDVNIKNYNLSYEKIFFDCSPTRNPGTYDLITGWETNPLMDHNATYYWNVVAAHQAVELYRKDKKTFRAKQYAWRHLIGHRNWDLIPELVWYPDGKCKEFANAKELNKGYKDGTLAYAPNDSKTFGYVVDSSVGECVGEEYRQPFRGAYRETIGLLMTIGYLTRRESKHWGESLVVTTLIRTTAYQPLVVARYPRTASKRSIHTAGRSIDISREQYKSDAQCAGFQYALDYLKYCGDICYGKENHAIHITLKPSAVEKYRRIYEQGMKFARTHH